MPSRDFGYFSVKWYSQKYKEKMQYLLLHKCIIHFNKYMNWFWFGLFGSLNLFKIYLLN